MRPLLAERGVVLSREQVYRLVTGVPERLSLATLAALCDILGCGPGDLVEPVAGARRGRPGGGRACRRGQRAGAPAGAGPGDRRRPRVAAVAARCPAGHELAWPLQGRPCTRCRREQVVAAVSAADPSLPGAVIAAAVDAAAPGGQALRHLADALAADPAALSGRGAAGRRAAGRRAGGPRLSHRDRPGVRGLRPVRQAAVPR